jgi:hypothetical protein
MSRDATAQMFMNATWSAAALALALLSGGATQPAAAQTPAQIAALPRGTVLETSVETSTDRVVFPSSLAGTIQAQPCSTCAARTLALDAATIFNLGGQQVSLQQMAKYCSTTSGKSLTIHYRISDSTVSLVSVLER